MDTLTPSTAPSTAPGTTAASTVTAEPTAQPTAPPTVEAPESVVEQDLLVEDVSIDGMCGVY